MLGGDCQTYKESELHCPPLWAISTFGSARLPDRRLNKRLSLIATRLATRPTDSFPHACGRWSETKGLYRFIENKRITMNHVIQPVYDSTAKTAAGGHPLILCIHDTSSLNYSRLKKTTGLGSIGAQEDRGLWVHSTLAAGQDGIPFGILGLNIWARKDEHWGQAKQRRQRKIEDKESFKWLQGIRQAREAFDRLPVQCQRPQLLHVMDREGDIHEIFEEIVNAGERAVIRCAQNRCVQGEVHKAHQAVRNAPLLGEVTIHLKRTHTQGERDARVQIRACKVILYPQSTKKRPRKAIRLTLVEVWEVDPPHGVEPLHWLLWTTEEVFTLQQALRVVEIYRNRWCIEQVHFVLKSGCHIEELQLETAERLKKAVALYLPVCVRIVQLRKLVERNPEVPCTAVLSEDEWVTLYASVHNRVPEAQTAVPTLQQAVMWIGRLGGHLGRKGDGLPGVRTLWRGWRDLQLLVQFHRVKNQPH